VTYLLAFAGFAVLIVLHEAGHFAAAKAVGMRVERFFLFFPPKLVSFRRGETEYGIGAVPLGGFVKITGMNPDEELPPEVAPRAYYHQPVWKRIFVIAAGPAVNIAIAFAILFILAFNVQEPTDSVDQIEPGSPAAGKLVSGDRILAVDGVSASQAELAERIDSHECAGDPSDGCRAATPAEITVQRDGAERQVRIRPFYDAAIDRNRVGFAFGLRPTDPGTLEAAGIAGEFMWMVASRTISVIGRLFEAEQRRQLSGVVGSYEVTRQAIDTDLRQALTLIAVISLSLGLINLFPCLPLDGGHIFWSLVEKVRGSPVSFRIMERAGLVGFALVIMLFMIGFTNDIGRLTGEGFAVR